MKRISCSIILVVVSLFFINNKVVAFDWATDEIKYGESVLDKSKISEYRNDDGSDSDYKKDIEKVCLYEGDDREGYNTDFVKYLFIYKDGTASMGWKINSFACERNSKSEIQCVDGYREGAVAHTGTLHRGMRNWSKNSDGVNSGAVKSYDAYTKYQKEGNCPTYIYQAVNGSSNYFYAYYNSSDSSTIKRNGESEPGSEHYLLYNVGESKKITSDLKCGYAYSKDDNDALVNVTFNSDAYVRVEPNFPNDLEFDYKGVNIKVKKDSIFVNHRLYSSAYLNHMSDGKCPKKIESCMYNYTELIGGASSLHFVLYGDSSPVTDSYCDGNNDAKIDLYCIGDNCSSVAICEYYDDLRSELGGIIAGYSSKSDKEKKEVLDKYNVKKDELNSFCISALANLNYSEGGCIEQCIENSKILAELEVQNGLRSNELNQKCGIGTSIISMIYNVLKWIKYILPVLVIIFTMLDFIKAIAAQNDDDMKKAQSKFVKRLIVAALLFLLPLIINFVLQTFGFYNSGCDITDLL